MIVWFALPEIVLSDVERECLTASQSQLRPRWIINVISQKTAYCISTSDTLFRTCGNIEILQDLQDRDSSRFASYDMTDACHSTSSSYAFQVERQSRKADPSSALTPTSHEVES